MPSVLSTLRSPAWASHTQRREAAELEARQRRSSLIFLAGPMRSKKTKRLQARAAQRAPGSFLAYRHAMDTRSEYGIIQSREAGYAPLTCRHVSNLYNRVTHDFAGSSAVECYVDEVHLFAYDDIRRTSEWCY